MTSQNILHVSSSALGEASTSRQLGNRLIGRLNPNNTATVVERNLPDGAPFLTAQTLEAIYTPDADRTAEQRALLLPGDALIAELQAADTLVISLPIYNFGPPAALKAWSDQTARAGETFKYTETGPVGLLPDRPAYIVSSSGGVEPGSAVDFATTWLTTYLGFLGITSVTLAGAVGTSVDPDGAIARANEQIDTLALGVAA